jgi:hypothetical protein
MSLGSKDSSLSPLLKERILTPEALITDEDEQPAAFDDTEGVGTGL